VSTRPAGSLTRIRRGVALVAGVLSIWGLVVVASGAGAAPRPTVAQVQAKINQLTTQFNRVSEQYDQASQQLSAAKTKLSRVRIHLKRARAQFQAAQVNVAQTAAAVFEDTGATSIAGLLTVDDPSVVLQQGSLLMELSGSRTAMTQQLLSDASHSHSSAPGGRQSVRYVAPSRYRRLPTLATPDASPPCATRSVAPTGSG